MPWTVAACRAQRALNSSGAACATDGRRAVQRRTHASMLPFAPTYGFTRSCPRGVCQDMCSWFGCSVSRCLCQGSNLS
eukprot:9998617-Alexandrium_andersonii.AAC.1